MRKLAPAVLAALALLVPRATADDGPVVVVEVFGPAPDTVLDAVRGAGGSVEVLVYEADRPESREPRAIYARQLGVREDAPFVVVGGSRALSEPSPEAALAAVREALAGPDGIPLRIAAGNRAEFHGLVVEFEVGELPEGAYLVAVLAEEGRVRAIERIRPGRDRRGRLELAPPEDLRSSRARVVAYVQVPPGMEIVAAAASPLFHSGD